MLITKSDVAKVRQISKALDDGLMNQAIEDAELLDLQPLLGELLYNDLDENFEDTKYQDLLNGKKYTHENNNYSMKGLKVVLANFAYARYIIFSGEKDTPFGLVTKTNQYSSHTEINTKKARAKSAEQIGYKYFNSVRDFLNRNDTTYPLWESCNNQRIFRFNKIS